MKGLLLGHVVQGPLRIAEAGKAVGADDQTVILLQHMLISHHYEPEFGAVKRPMFPEAEMLHYLDMIDARMFDFRKALAVGIILMALALVVNIPAYSLRERLK